MDATARNPVATDVVTAADLIRQRFSCRTYRPERIPAERQRLLAECMEAHTLGPLGSRARFRLVAATPDDDTSLRRLGTYGFIKGAAGFIVGAARRAPNDLEDYGHLLEQIVLYATGLGLGTCWLGGTFTRSSFVRRFGGLEHDETLPAVISVGLPDEDGVTRIRAREEGERRLPASELFFEGSFAEPLEFESMRAAGYADALDAVRMAPSATNKQPWRLVRGDGAWHFYLRRTKGYGKGSALFKVLRIADLQRVDLGVAMCHFELVARERGLTGRWLARDPGVPLPGKETEYVVSWLTD